MKLTGFQFYRNSCWEDCYNSRAQTSSRRVFWFVGRQDSMKLTNEKAYIRNFGIKDGDQLQFIRHMSISNSPLKRQFKSESVPDKQHSTLTYGSNGHKDEEESGLEGSENNAVHEDNSNEDLEEGPVPQFKVVHYLSGWLSCSKVMGGLKKGIRRQGPSIEIQAIRKLI
ncbi:Ubiquitin-like superfamily protein [Prunus dulcis]|uniref:Ubiquitin-like superfamily protein n=1 Tax=Prunus dulcis TaxID=3755 RepID=A0A4Y1R4L2_PRUDU|nr:Ubiquitin-like superfamily protein [Prunus dulcis]